MSERKYRQRGYMDKEPREERRAPQGPRPERSDGGPRGRGLGAPTATVFRCRVCGEKQVLAEGVATDRTCSRCGADLHTCSNCAHFDSSRPNECRKPILQRVTSKATRNNCELFAANTIQEFGSDRVAASSDPRAAFDALFRKK